MLRSEGFSYLGGEPFRMQTTPISQGATRDTWQERYEQLEQEYAKLQQLVAELSARLKWYDEQFRLARHRQFGASSERTPPEQLHLGLFNEPEAEADPKKEEPDLETITYQRRKQPGQREAPLQDLPVETVEYRLPAEEQVCPDCQGPLHVMSTEVRRELKDIPAQVKVVQHVRHVYSCRRCEREGTETPVLTAPMPKPALPGSLASPSLLALIMTQKYVDALPLYRQEEQWARVSTFCLFSDGIALNSKLSRVWGTGNPASFSRARSWLSSRWSTSCSTRASRYSSKVRFCSTASRARDR